MQDRPDTLELLAASRAAILDKVAPELKGEARKEALMVANALSIIERELKAADYMRQWELRALHDLLGLQGDMSSGAPDERLTALSRRLAIQIRSGAFDEPGARREQVGQFLREATLGKLRINNPKMLSRETQT